MRNQSRSMSRWIWRRFAYSYRQQLQPGVSVPLTGPPGGYPWVSTTQVGAGANFTAQTSQTILATRGDLEALASGNNFQDEAGVAQSIGGSRWYSAPLPGRRVAVKRIAGNLDLFPFAFTAGLGEAMYVHLWIQRNPKAGVGAGVPLNTPTVLYPTAPQIPDMEGQPPLWYRRFCWYYGGFTGLTGSVAVQSAVRHVPVKLLFKRPLVLDMGESISLNMQVDVQPSPLLATGSYNCSYLPYLSFLCNTL